MTQWLEILVTSCCWVLVVSAQLSEDPSSAISRYVPPKLDLEGPYIDVPANSTIRITCFGRHPVEWSLPSTGENVSLRSAVYNEESLDDVRPYKSVLEVNSSDVMDMGRYSCVYNGTTDLDNSGNVTSIYVFVNDEYYFFQPEQLSGDTFLVPVTHGKRVVVPCRPTHSKAEAYLWKNLHDTFELVKLEPDFVEFDPMQGFVIHYPYSYYSGRFMCNGSLSDKEFVIDSVSAVLLYYAPADYVSYVVIQKSEHFHPVINGSFSLNCTTTVDISALVIMTWDYPNKNDSRIVITPPQRNVMKTGHEQITFAVISSQLTVNNVQRSDEGVYTCFCTDHVPRKFNQSVLVTVYESEQAAQVNLTADFDGGQILNATEGGSIKIAVKVNAHPSFEAVRFTWKKDGALLRPAANVSIVTKKPQVVFEKTNVAFDDGGLYTLYARIGNATSKLSVQVDVSSKPIVTILNKTELYERDSNYSLVCNLKGTPPIKGWWEWKKCPHPDACSGDDNFRRIATRSPSANRNVVVMASEGLQARERNLTLQLKAVHSALYRCVAENELGNAKDEATFYVTDAKNGFEIRAPATTPVEKDRVMLSCLVSHFRYVGLTWKWRAEGAKDFTIITQSTESRKINNRTSQYSHQLTLEFDSISLGDRGEYECFAYVRGSATQRHREFVKLVVRQIKAPRFNVTNLNNNKMQDVPFIDLFCSASGVPEPTIMWYKDGRPLNLTSFEQRQKGRWIVKRKVDQEDSGFYQCRAENRGGSVYKNVTLTVASAVQARGLNNGHIALIVVSILIFGFFVVLLYYYVKRVLKDRKYKMDTELLSNTLFNKGQVEFFNPDLPLCEQAELLPYDQRWEFPKDRLKLGRTLGQGAFGRVVKAEAIGLGQNGEPLTVAVKMLKERADPSQQKALMAELKILIALGRHLNIVNILGAVTKNVAKGELMMIVEYCKFGNLRHYLLRHRERFVNQLNPLTGKLDPDSFFRARLNSQSQRSPQAVWNPIYCHEQRYLDLLHSPSSPDQSGAFTFPQSFGEGDFSDSRTMRDRADSSSTVVMSGSSLRDHGDYKDGVLTTRDLLCYAFQCARGMEYLASRKLIHRDLAARNVLLSKENVVKICDFGLAKDCYKYSNYVKKGDGLLPVKWTAIESIMDRVFTTKSDVWSYGVLLWEIFSLGGNPYPGVSIDESFYKKLKNGYRMERPDYAPNDVYEVMRSCWQLDPKDRPDFSTLVTKVGDLLEDGVRDYYVALNEPYMNINRNIKNNNDYLSMESRPDSDYLVMKSDEDNYINTKMHVADTATQYANLNNSVYRGDADIAAVTAEPSEDGCRVQYANVDGSLRLRLPERFDKSPPSPTNDSRSSRSDDLSEICATPPPSYSLVVSVDVNSDIVT